MAYQYPMKSKAKLFFILTFFFILFSPSFNDGFVKKAFAFEVVPTNYLRLVSTDSQNPNYLASYAIDGNTKTFWHTEWYPTAKGQPHEIVIDLGSSQPVTGMRYLSRQDKLYYGYIKGYEIYVSDSTSSWGDAVASGEFNIFQGDSSQKEVLFPEKNGRYLKFVSLSESSGTPYAAAAEISVLATTFTPPVITGPEISVGLWPYTKTDIQATPFKITANKPYNIKDKSGNVLLKVSDYSSGMRVTYLSGGDLKFYNSTSLVEGISNQEISFDAADGNNNELIFDINRPNSSYDNYRGKIKIRYTDSNNIWVINTLPLEHYVWGMGETTGTGNINHTKVMTTIFRTYGYWYIKYATKYAPYGFKIRSDSGSQIYRGYDWESTYTNIKKAAEETRGIVATYQGDVALTPYSSWSDGRTRSFQERWGSTNYPWCQSVSDPYGKNSTMTTTQLESAGNHMVGLIANGSVKLSANYGWDWQKIMKYYYTGISLITQY